MNEEQLKNAFQKAQTGDREAFGYIYDKFAEKIFKFIYYRVGEKETAEDILAETFIKAWQKIAHIQSHKTILSWLYQVAKNKIIDYYRSKKISVPLDEVENFLENAVDPVDTINLDYEQKMLKEILQELSEEHQKIIRYKFFEELSNAEIALIMNKSEGAIRVIQHRAITKLKQSYQKKDQKNHAEE